MSISRIDAARICHQANKAFCEAIYDDSQVNWEEAPEWQKQSAIKGVSFCMDNPDAPASANHDSWLKEKVGAGWVYGEVKDADKKTHPCCIPYDQLPPKQQVKDYLFRAVVGALVNIIEKN